MKKIPWKMIGNKEITLNHIIKEENLMPAPE